MPMPKILFGDNLPLLRALPPARRIQVNWDDAARQLREFYAVSDENTLSAKERIEWPE